ncbi:hypothetical protein EG68_11199 [Paragonimus skrjabini miyazakii]|uniref:Amino acid transporter n=1 Tax=Paragonimus skrjabini miyazakii TaxID=59628 RepID=A0A8S9Y9Z7_9TREM|nr:hypothetical protein EG68_11199 [Paragonimus skrjabini miyazakii]
MGKMTSVFYCLKQNVFLLSTTICIAIGVAVGMIMRVFHAPDVAILYVGLPGELFMRALNFSVIPLLACNIVAVTAKLKPSEQGMVVVLSILYCIAMNLLGSFIGLVATVLINPGGRFGVLSLYGANRLTSAGKLSMTDIFPDFLRNLVPDNILKTLLYSTVTTYTPVESVLNNNGTTNVTVFYQRTVDVTSGPNILGEFLMCGY